MSRHHEVGMSIVELFKDFDGLFSLSHFPVTQRKDFEVGCIQPVGVTAHGQYREMR